MSEVAISPILQSVEIYYSELRAFARRKVGNPAAAEDLVQEACLRLASPQSEIIDNPRAFLYRVVGNLIIDFQRKERTRTRNVVALLDGVDAPDEAPDVERQLVAKQRLAILSHAIAQLPPRCRECFVMRRFDGLGQDEIARRMGISRNMVEKHLRLAAVHCATRLRESD
ncbi:MAG: sigma-70 family RNA polymerase sigma factor [Pseudolabrys sp.]|nr:sigma-70 family RNA polymerase sigma factor [Pseudolabrys sp.]